MNLLVSKRENLLKVQKDLGAIFAAKPDLDFTSEEVESIQAKNAEAKDLAIEVERLVDLESIRTAVTDEVDGKGKAVRSPIFPSAEQMDEEEREERTQSKATLGEIFVKSKAFTEYNKAGQEGPSLEINLVETFGKARARYGLKATFDTATGYPLQAIRLPDPITPMEQAVTVSDLFPQGRTSTNSIVYMEETTTTNAAAETAEGAAKPEATLAFTEKNSPVRKIAVFLPVTDESMEDAPAMTDYLNNRLRTFVQQREDQQLLTGNGTAPNLRGILNVAGIQTQAKGADPVPDAIYKAIIKISVLGFMDASGVVMHPNDWQDVRLLRTVDGIYIWGNPADPGPDRIWGLPVVKTTAITENTALVGAFRDGAQIFRRSDIAVQVSNSHNDFFQKNLLAIRAEERLALVPFRPKAFCTVTGI